MRKCTSLQPATFLLCSLIHVAIGNVTARAFDDEKADTQNASAQPTSSEALRARGEKIYRQQCADCHGNSGQGVESAYEEPLIGDDSVGQLSEVIARTMPEGEPELCAGADAAAVAEYVHYAFYSEAARVRNRPPEIRLGRLTAEQLRQSLADIYTTHNWHNFSLPAERGVEAMYFDGDRWKKEKLKIERVDPTIDFDFGRESPGEGIQPEAFFIQWTGGLFVEETGRYEIVVDSSCSFVMDFGHSNRQLINNHVQSGDKTEFRRSLHLTGGRIYPFEIEFRQRKRKTEIPPANISLKWVPPGGVEQVIPTRNLIPQGYPAAFALQTDLPPDDRSYGFERGLSVSRAWDESTTNAALEMADVAFEELWPEYLRRHRKDPGDDRTKLADFLAGLLKTAFRGDLDSESRRRFVELQLASEPDDREAIKRVLLVGLKTPRFLYPGLDAQLSPSQRAANQIALIMFDSVPVDTDLVKLAEQGKLSSEPEVRRLVQSKMSDARLRAKVQSMMHEWLNVSHIGEVTKDATLFPEFSPALFDELRQSLDAFISDVAWSENADFRKLFLADWSYTSPAIASALGDAWEPAEALSPKAAADAENGLDETNNVKGDTVEEDAAKNLPSSPVIALVRTKPSSQHRGILTHPYLLSGLAYHDSTSPIHRGVFLIRHVLGRTLRPPNDAFTPLSPDLHPDLTTRERVALQTSPDACQVCHSKINALGFALENFDAMGRFQSQERGKKIDSSGSYVTRSGDSVEFDDYRSLAEFLAGSRDTHTAIVRKAFQHFVKQPPAAFGADTLERLTDQFANSGYNMKKLVEDIVVLAALNAAQRSTP